MLRTSWYLDMKGPNRNNEGYYYTNGWLCINSFPFKVKKRISPEEWKRRSQIRTLVNCFLLTHMHELVHWAGEDHPQTIKERNKWDQPLNRILGLNTGGCIKKRRIKKRQ